LSPELIQRHVFVSGLVQGVGFRRATQDEVEKYTDAAIRGFVRNLVDGRVEAVFCGERDSVLKIVAWCRKGPEGAKVSRLEVIEERPDPGLPPFEFRKTEY